MRWGNIESEVEKEINILVLFSPDYSFYHHIRIS